MADCEVSVFTSKQKIQDKPNCSGSVRLLITQEPLEKLKSISVIRRPNNLVQGIAEYNDTALRNLDRLGICEFTLDDSINTADTSFYKLTIPKKITSCSQFSVLVTTRMLSFFDNKLEIFLDDKERFVVQLGEVVPTTGFSNPISDDAPDTALQPQYIVLIVGAVIVVILVIVWVLMKRRERKKQAEAEALQNAYYANYYYQ